VVYGTLLEVTKFAEKEEGARTNPPQIEEREQRKNSYAHEIH
jgi:hypothetical protein